MNQIGNYSISSVFRADNPMTNQKDEYCLKIMWWSKFLVTVCYCSHDVRPATHLAILNRLWRWGEMHSSQNTHPPCQSAEWLTREWTVTKITPPAQTSVRLLSSHQARYHTAPGCFLRWLLPQDHLPPVPLRLSFRLCCLNKWLPEEEDSKVIFILTQDSFLWK